VSTIDALPGVVKAVGKKADVILDGGVRHQSDVLIALALGAKAVTLGRPVMWGLAVGGGEGVTRVLQEFKTGVQAEAMLCGVTSVANLPDDLAVRAA
jgi:4-hydroxymandelate oxidase